MNKCGDTVKALKVVVGKTDFLLQKRQLSQTWKVYWNLYWISVHLVYGRSLGEQFLQRYFDLIEVVFLGLKIDKYTYLQLLYFLHLIQYLLQFSTYKNLTYIKFLQMLRRFCRTKQFIYSCSTSRVKTVESESTFFASPHIWFLL